MRKGISQHIERLRDLREALARTQNTKERQKIRKKIEKERKAKVRKFKLQASNDRDDEETLLLT